MQSKSLERLALRKRLIISSLYWHRYIAAHLLSTSLSSCKNHYEILELQRNCSSTEIKDAFIRLSKEVHPDKNLNRPDVHQKFVLLNEAYSVLSRPHKRRMYDAELTYQEVAKMHNFSGVVTNAPRDRVVFRDTSLWEHRDRSQDWKYQGRPYYGIRSIKKRLSNGFIAGVIVVFTIIGALGHFYLAKRASEFANKQLDEKSRIAGIHYMIAKQQALINGNKLQMELLQNKNEDSNQEK